MTWALIEYLLSLLLTIVCRFKVDMSQFPVIARINETLLQIDEFKASHPSQQPDCPAELRS